MDIYSLDPISVPPKTFLFFKEDVSYILIVGNFDSFPIPSHLSLNYSQFFLIKFNILFLFLHPLISNET